MKIAIVGGAGKMGQCLAVMLAGYGQDIILIDRDREQLESARKLLKVETSYFIEEITRADAVIITVPIAGFAEAVRSVAAHSLPSQVVLDITSVKTMPVEVMHRCLPENLVLGTHPVFGPATTSIKGQNIVLTPTNPKENDFAEKLRRVLAGQGASISVMTPEKHDELMAVVLGLAHYISLVAGDTLISLGNFNELSQVSGPTFRGLLSFIESVVYEDPALYAAIQMNLASLPSVQRGFIDESEEWAAMVKNKDAAGFAARMSALSAQMKRQRASH